MTLPYNDIDVHRRTGTRWPDGELPRLSRKEAISAAKRLWRRAMGKAWPGTWQPGYGNVRTRPRGKVFIVNPGQGWRDIVHELSHSAYARLVGHRQRMLYLGNGEWADTASDQRRDNFRHVRRFDGAGRYRHHTNAHAEIEREMIQMVLDQGWLGGRLK